MSSASDKPRDLTGATTITLVWRVPNDKIAALDAFEAVHERFMTTTHPTEGEEALLYYTLSRTAEPKNPMDPSEGVTEFTIATLQEAYATPAGVAMHFREAGKDDAAGGTVLKRFQALTSEFVIFAHIGPVTASYSGGATSASKPLSLHGTTSLTVAWVLDADQAELLKSFTTDHPTWMARTHPTSGDEGLLHYTISVTPQLSEPTNPESEPTGKTSVVLHEVYSTPAGVAKHFALAGEDKEAGGNILSIFTKLNEAGSPVFNMWSTIVDSY